MRWREKVFPHPDKIFCRCGNVRIFPREDDGLEQPLTQAPKLFRIPGRKPLWKHLAEPQHGYAAVLASYFPKKLPFDIAEFGLKEFQINIPSQTLILVSPASLLDYNLTSRTVFDLLKAELQARLKA